MRMRDPVASITDLIHGAIYLTALRDPANDVTVDGYSENGIQSLIDLTGVNFGKTGPLIDLTQPVPNLTLLKVLFAQLFSDANTRTSNYISPAQGVIDLNHGAIYLAALRDSKNNVTVDGYTRNGIQSLLDFTGIDLGQSGPLVDESLATPDLTKVKLLFEQLFSDANTHTANYSHPRQGVIDLNHGAIYLAFLRATPGALDAFNFLQGTNIGASGPLTLVEIQSIFNQLFDKNGNHTRAYQDPKLAIGDLFIAEELLKDDDFLLRL